MVTATFFLLSVALLGGGCENGTAPEAPDPVIQAPVGFAPPESSVDLACGLFGDFQVVSRGVTTNNPVWRSTDGQTGTGPRFRYFARRWRPDTLEVEVYVGGVPYRHSWIIDMVTGLDAGFRPRSNDLRIIFGMDQLFEVDMTCAPLGVAWYLDDEPVADGYKYLLAGDRTGAQSVAAVVSLPDTTLSHVWSVVVTAPGEDFVYTPTASEISLYETQYRYFAVTSISPLPEVIWAIDGVPAGTGPEFDFVAGDVGNIRITASMALPDTNIIHGWDVEVFSASANAPAPVVDLVVATSTRLGQATCVWSAVSPGVFPLVAYELRASTDGPVTADNWHLARPVGEGTFPPEPDSFLEVVWTEDEGWLSGQEVCFGVRARNELGLWSELVASPCLVVASDWWMHGNVVGPDGTPVADAQVSDLRSGMAVTTDVDGAFVVGPFASRDTVELETTGFAPAWDCDWTSQLTAKLTWLDEGRWDFRLLPALGADPTCGMFRSDFARYLRMMTLTNYELSGKPNFDLLKWDSYPVDVYVPDWVSPAGIDYGAACRQAVEIWNASMGEEYLRMVAEQPEIGIFFEYELDIDTMHARAKLVQPGDGNFALAFRIPELVRVDLAPDFSRFQGLTEVALHELGHCLGIYGHAWCKETGYIMNITSAGSLNDGPENAIHQDERNALRIIRILPQSTDMSVYPWY